MPVRAIPRSHRNVTGRVAIEGGRAVAFESTLERDFVLMCQFTPGFLSIEEQPVAIRLPNGRRYVPDFLVQWSGRQPDLVEVKPSDRMYEVEPKRSPAESFARERGWRFIVASEQDIRTPRLTNARFLLPFRRRTVDPGIAARLIATLKAEVLSLDRVLAAAFPGQEERLRALPVLWHLVATFRIAANLDVALTMDSRAWLADGR